MSQKNSWRNRVISCSFSHILIVMFEPASVGHNWHDEWERSICIWKIESLPKYCERHFIFSELLSPEELCKKRKTKFFEFKAWGTPLCVRVVQCELYNVRFLYIVAIGEINPIFKPLEILANFFSHRNKILIVMFALHVFNVDYHLQVIQQIQRRFVRVD